MSYPFELRPQRMRLRQEPQVLERVEWRTIRTAENTPLFPNADDPAPTVSDVSDGDHDDLHADS